MKTKKTSVIALTLITIGLIVCIISFGFGFGFDFKKSNNDYETYSFEKSYDSGIENINFDIDCGDIRIVEGDNLKLEVKDAIVNTVKESIKNNTLTVTQNNPKKANGNFTFSIFGHSINSNNSIDTEFTLTIPKGTKFNKIEFENNVSNITAYELTCESFLCDIDVGEVDIDNLNCEKTKISSNVAQVTFKNANINDCDITSDVGDIKIKGVVTGTNKFSTDVGDLELELIGDVENYSFSVDKGIGSAEINGKRASSFENESAPNTFDITHDIGDVDITIN